MRIVRIFAANTILHLPSCSGDKKSPLGHNAAVLACQAIAKDLLKELQAWKQMRFKDWEDMTMEKLGYMKVDQTGKLMDMDSRDGHIKLHYNEDLVVLLREVWQWFPCLARKVLLSTACAHLFSSTPKAVPNGCIACIENVVRPLQYPHRHQQHPCAPVLYAGCSAKHVLT